MADVLSVVQALKALGIHAESFRAWSDGSTGVNFWPTPEARYPGTAYPPGESWSWGDNFEHRAPADADATTVAAMIKETL